MKKFKFQLAALLKVTQMKKEQAELKFAEATQILYQRRQLLAEFEHELQEGINQYYQLSSGKIVVAELMSYHTYFERMKSQIDRQKIEIENAAKHREACLVILRVAMNKLKTIEQLKEKRYEQFKKNQLAEEQKELDEIGIQIYTRIVR